MDLLFSLVIFGVLEEFVGECLLDEAEVVSPHALAQVAQEGVVVYAFETILVDADPRKAKMVIFPRVH